MIKTFADIQQDTPRLVVMYKHEAGKDMYQWGMVGHMPLSDLIGAVTRVQSEIYFRAAEACPESALVLVWDAEDRRIKWFIHSSIPHDSVVGMLEMIKHAFINSQAAKRAANQQLILGPDGKPIGR